ncbi:MAG: damage-inducible protein D [Burkholderiales bacterium]|nr:damage-inducible protein D [Burkholderiales bacterium]
MTTGQNLSIEDIAKENGIRFWYAHDLSKYLEYKDFDNFKSVIKKARATMDQIGGIDSDDEFIPMEVDGIKTYKLTRFACLLSVLSADNKKPRVAIAKAGLAKFVDIALQQYAERLERLEERSKLTHGEQYMSGIAQSHGMSSDKFAIFKDAGYRGMYNMSITDLKNYKGVGKKDTLYDYMGITELAANTFRVTQTAERIKSANIKSENGMIQAAKEVGKEVRNIVIHNTHKNPEDLAIEAKITEVKKEIKATRKKMINHDKKK